jgi:hypothetical protein
MHSTRSDVERIYSRVFAGASPEEACILAWPLVCGAGVAERTEAVGFCNGVLVVKVSDRSWKSQLESFALQYAHRLSAIVGTTVKIEYVIGADAEAFRTSTTAR